MPSLFNKDHFLALDSGLRSPNSLSQRRDPGPVSLLSPPQNVENRFLDPVSGGRRDRFLGVTNFRPFDVPLMMRINEKPQIPNYKSQKNSFSQFSND